MRKAGALSSFRFFVMAGVDPAMYENPELCNQAKDLLAKLEIALERHGWPGQARP
jgi:hypothetical protein